ncbi:MAG: hypothetical protein R3F46_06170 [bacterium]
MSQWLKIFLIVFIVVNLLALVAGIPNPISLFIEGFGSSQRGTRTLDGGLAGLSIIMGIAMLLGWGVVALVMWLTMGRKAA